MNIKNIKLKHFLFVCTISLLVSCTVSDSVAETEVADQIQQENKQVGKLVPSDLVTRKIDGKIVNNTKKIMKSIKEAYVVHYDYVNGELAIFSTEKEFKKYLTADLSLDRKFREARTSSVLQVDKKPATPVMKRDEHYLVADYSDHAFFMYERADTYGRERMYLYKAPTLANIDADEVQKYSVRNGGSVASAPTTFNTNINFDLTKVGVSGNSVHVRNPDTGYTYLLFYKGINYTGNISWVSIPPNSHLKLVPSNVRPNGNGTAVANSLKTHQF